MPRKRTLPESCSAPPPFQKPRLDVSARLSAPTLTSAVRALLADAAAFAGKNEVKRGRDAALLERELFVTLVVTFKHAPFKTKLRPYALPLRHALYKEGEDEICFFVKDPQRLVKDHLAKHGSSGVTRVLGVDKLRKRYKTHESRRELLGLYDLFLVDNRVAPMMPSLLGNAFLNAKRMPLPVDMRKNVTAGIRKAVSAASFCPRQGTSTAVKVAKGEWGGNWVEENVRAAVEGVVNRVGWDAIQSLSLKTNKSPALPIYLALPTEAVMYKKGGEMVVSGGQAAGMDMHTDEKMTSGQNDKQADVEASPKGVKATDSTADVESDVVLEKRSDRKRKSEEGKVKKRGQTAVDDGKDASSGKKAKKRRKSMEKAAIAGTVKSPKGAKNADMNKSINSVPASGNVADHHGKAERSKPDIYIEGEPGAASDDVPSVLRKNWTKDSNSNKADTKAKKAEVENESSLEASVAPAALKAVSKAKSLVIVKDDNRTENSVVVVEESASKVRAVAIDSSGGKTTRSKTQVVTKVTKTLASKTTSESSAMDNSESEADSGLVDRPAGKVTRARTRNAVKALHESGSDVPAPESEADSVLTDQPAKNHTRSKSRSATTQLVLETIDVDACESEVDSMLTDRSTEKLTRSKARRNATQSRPMPVDVDASESEVDSVLTDRPTEKVTRAKSRRVAKQASTKSAPEDNAMELDETPSVVDVSESDADSVLTDGAAADKRVRRKAASAASPAPRRSTRGRTPDPEEVLPTPTRRSARVTSKKSEVSTGSGETRIATPMPKEKGKAGGVKRSAKKVKEDDEEGDEMDAKAKKSSARKVKTSKVTAVGKPPKAPKAVKGQDETPGGKVKVTRSVAVRATRKGKAGSGVGGEEGR